MFDSAEKDFVKITFRMEIGDLIDSIMVQLYPIHFAQELCEKFSLK
jgi:flagellar motor switch protein FliN/FliY